MYAVILSGGKQHRVAEGQVIRLEKLEAETGVTVEFDKVLMVAQGEEVKVGAPYVAGGKVVAEVVTHGRGDKVKIVKVYVGEGEKTELSLTKTYRVVANEFIAGGGDHFTQFTAGKKVGILTGTDTETFISYLKQQTASGKQIASPALNRKVEISAAQAAALEK